MRKPFSHRSANIFTAIAAKGEAPRAGQNDLCSPNQSVGHAPTGSQVQHFGFLFFVQHHRLERGNREASGIPPDSGMADDYVVDLRGSTLDP